MHPLLSLSEDILSVYGLDNGYTLYYNIAFDNACFSSKNLELEAIEEEGGVISKSN